MLKQIETKQKTRNNDHNETENEEMKKKKVGHQKITNDDMMNESENIIFIIFNNRIFFELNCGKKRKRNKTKKKFEIDPH